MHLDEAFQEIGVGIVQRFTIGCMALLALTEGLIPVGLLAMAPQTLCDFQLPFTQLTNLFIPFLFGMTMGAIILGGLSDVGGRRYTLGISSAITFLTVIVTSAAPTSLIYEIATIALGIAVAGIHAGTRLLLFETLPMKSRGSYMVFFEIFTRIGVFFALGWGHLMMSEPTAVKNFPNLRPWRLLLFLCAILSILGSCLIGLIPFSTRQMLAHQRVVSVTIILRRFYAINKGEHESSYPNYPLEPFINVETRNYSRNQCAEYLVFICRCIGLYIVEITKWPNCIKTAALMLIHVCLLDGYWALNTVGTERLKHGNSCEVIVGRAMSPELAAALCQEQLPPLYLLNIYLALATLLPPVILPFFIDKCNRIGILAASCFMAGVSSFVLVYSYTWYLEVVTCVILVIAQATATTVLGIITLEAYPTKYRSTAYGMCKLVSTLFLIVIALMTNEYCLRLFNYIPYLFFAATITSLLLESKDRKPILE